MTQNINMFPPELRPEGRAFPATFMVKSVGVLVVALALIYVFAESGVRDIEREIEIVARQEAAAIEQLQNLGSLITAITGEKSWAEQLEEAMAVLREREAVLKLIQGTTLGETDGFSRHLRALSRQDIDGIWLTYIALSALGDKTRLEGRALRAEMIPLYVQDLTAESAFAKQRFHHFRILNTDDESGAPLHFSMDSQLLLADNQRRAK